MWALGVPFWTTPRPRVLIRSPQASQFFPIFMASDGAGPCSLHLAGTSGWVSEKGLMHLRTAPSHCTMRRVGAADTRGGVSDLGMTERRRQEA